MAKLNKLGTHKTTACVNEYNIMVVTYHQTQIVKFDHNTILLNTGGYKTNITKTRMNQASNQFNLGYQVYQKNHLWYVDFKDNTYTFTDNILTLTR